MKSAKLTDLMLASIIGCASTISLAQSPPPQTNRVRLPPSQVQATPRVQQAAPGAEADMPRYRMLQFTLDQGRERIAPSIGVFANVVTVVGRPPVRCDIHNNARGSVAEDWVSGAHTSPPCNLGGEYSVADLLKSITLHFANITRNYHINGVTVWAYNKGSGKVKVFCANPRNEELAVVSIQNPRIALSEYPNNCAGERVDRTR